MMQLTNLLNVALAFAGTALAAPTASPAAAVITVEASHGGAGSGLTNTTINVPLDTTYTDQTSLAAVSTLYLVATTDQGVSTTSVTCTPYLAAGGSVTPGIYERDGD
jgi:hypothetical protein